MHLERWADRVFHAHGRAVERYTTVARWGCSPDVLAPVGSLDDVRSLVGLDNELAGGDTGALVAAWLDLTVVDTHELKTTQVRHQVVRELEQAWRTNPMRAREIVRFGPQMYRRGR